MMPSALLVPAATGAGMAAFTAGPQLVTDIDTLITSLGPSMHLFPTGVDFRVQHAGWIAIGSTVGIFPGGIGPPTFDVWWWEFLDFVAEDKQLVGKLTFPADTLAWNLAVGCTVRLNVSY
jgi:hypothetical protein